MAVFESGAKSTEEKPRYDLIPHVALEREAIRMAEGAKAHGENNYRMGALDCGFITDRINHVIDHALQYAAGDRSDDHLAAIRCGTGMLMWMEAFRATEGVAYAFHDDALGLAGAIGTGSAVGPMCVTQNASKSLEPEFVQVGDYGNWVKKT